MALCEALLISIIASFGFIATYTDIREGIISNFIIIVMGGLGIVVQSVYLMIFYREGIQLYFTNLVGMFFISLCLYGFHFWAAGDTKLLACIVLLFPVRFYTSAFGNSVPGIGILICIFGLAYIYILIDSVVRFARRERFFGGERDVIATLKSFGKSFLLCFVYIRLFGRILAWFLPEFYYGNIVAFSFINIFLAILVTERKIFCKWYTIAMSIVLNIFFSLDYSWRGINVLPYIVLVLALILRFFMSGYNYEEVQTESVKRGMVLSMGTVLAMTKSKIDNLPRFSYEDMRSRLSAEEVDAVKAWGNSKDGRSTIVIVRKIPFAIFIVAGTIIFFIGGSFLSW